MKTLSSLVIAAIVCTSFFFLPENKNENQHQLFSKENPHEAYDALTFLTAMNAFPNADIPPAAYAKAWQRHREIVASNTYSGSRSTWQNIGPDNIGGRTCGIAVDAADTNIIWLGSASGGLWKSEKGGIGSTWQYIPTGFPVLGVSAIAIDPSDHNTLLIGTGETYAYGTSTNGLMDRTQRGSVGIGILKTTDGGITWTHVLDWSYQQGSGVWEILYDPVNMSNVFAATTEGVYKSIDGGNTWTQVLDKKMVMDMVIDITDPKVLYAGVGNEDSNDKGIYKTTDAGVNWSLLTNGLPSNAHDGRITLASYKGDHNILMALIGNRYSTVGIYKTTDAGASWTLQSTSDIVSYQGWYAKGLLIKQDDSTKVLAGGVSLFKSNTSGVSWAAFGYVHSDVHDIVSNPLDNNKVYVVTDGGLYRSNAFAGNNWYECADGYVTSQSYIGSVSVQNPDDMLSGLQDNSTVVYSGSVTWGSVIGGDGCYNAIDPTDDNIQYGSYQYLNIEKSTNSGNSWSGIYSSPSDVEGGNPAGYLAPFTIGISNTDILYAGTQTLIKTTDGGNNWNEVQPNPLDHGNYLLSIGVAPSNVNVVYFATAPSTSFPMHLYRSDDGGTTKHDITGTLPNRYLRRITVSPTNSSEVYAVFSGFNSAAGGHIFKSEDAGINWTDISTALPDVPFHCLAIDPNAPSNIYAGCDFTVYASSDYGADWFAYDDGFPDALMVFDLVVSPADNSIVAFTHGHGQYKNDLLDDAVGILNSPGGMSVNIFPNPASNSLSIDLSRLLQNADISIYDLNGKVVLKKHCNEIRKANFDISNLGCGSYFLNVTGDGFHATSSVSVMR